MSFHDTSGAGKDATVKNIIKELVGKCTFQRANIYGDLNIEELFQNQEIGMEDAGLYINQDIIMTIFKPINSIKISRCGSIDILNLKISSLVELNLPKSIHGSLSITNCKNLRTLEGCPMNIQENFKIYNSPIKSLEYGPIHVGRGYNIDLLDIDSLDYTPDFIFGDFQISSNGLIDLSKLPEVMGGIYISLQNGM